MDDHDFWYKVAAWSFGVWAAMIPLGVGMIRSSIAKATTVQEKFLEDFHAYVVKMERRMTRLEERLRINEEDG